jgi:hypothetical protein
MPSTQERNNGNNTNNNERPRKKKSFINDNGKNGNNKPRKLIITDYNPLDVYDVNEAGNFLQIKTEQINPVSLTKKEKHFFYPSSFFLYKNTDLSVFAPALCIHKFKHNNATLAPPSYTLHPIILEILKDYGLNIDNVIEAFRNIIARQTLLVKLPGSKSISQPELDELKRKYVFEDDGYNYSVLHNTSVRIGDSKSVIEITPGYELPEAIPAEEEVLGNNETNGTNTTSMYGETVGMGKDFNVKWSQGMETQPRANTVKENFPPKNMDGTPGTPTQKNTQKNQPHFISGGGSYSRTKRTNRIRSTKPIKSKKKNIK